jgi:hypothetical protein
MDCFAEEHRMESALKTDKLFYKTPALVSHRVRCGKPRCHCVDGAGHGPYWFLHWREGGIQRRRYVRRADVAAVRAVIDARHRDDRELRRVAALASDDLRRLREWLKDLHAS